MSESFLSILFEMLLVLASGLYLIWCVEKVLHWSNDASSLSLKLFFCLRVLGTCLALLTGCLVIKEIPFLADQYKTQFAIGFLAGFYYWFRLGEEDWCFEKDS